MNWKSQILHYDEAGSSYFGRDIDAIDERRAVFFPETAKTCADADRYIFDLSPSVEAEVDFKGIGRVTLCYVSQSRSYHFRNSLGKYLCFDGEEDYSFSRDSVGLWESFFLLSGKDIASLRHILSNRWVQARDDALVESSDIRIDHQFSLAIGRLNIDIRRLDFSLAGAYEFFGFVDGWKVEKFHLYRPLIYLTAFSDGRIISQLGMCVRSLLDIGLFDGKIVIMTDKSLEDIACACRVTASELFKILSLQPKDFTGYVCAKYSIYESEEFSGYQPIMYLDPDIICDLPITDLLAAAATSERICAPLEGWNQLRHHPPIGATLMQLDGLEARFASGLNGGTITIPNVDNALLRERFELIRLTVTNIGDKFGRDFNHWADQEVANYIAYKCGCFDTNRLTRFIQWQDGKRPLNNNRLGLVHFWGHSTDEKVERMERYLDELTKLAH